MGFIYRYIVDGEVIYLGKTKRDLTLRIKEHEQEVKFMPYLSRCKIQYFETATITEMDMIEKYYINYYSPKLNVVDMEHAHYDYMTIAFEPVWKDYSLYVPSEKEKTFVTQNDSIQNEIDQNEAELDKLENFRQWADYMWDKKVHDTLDIQKGIVTYKWDLDEYPLPDTVYFEDIPYGIWSLARKVNNDYVCRISYSDLLIILQNSNKIYREMYVPIRVKIMDLEEKLS